MEWTPALEAELRWLILRYYRSEQVKVGALSCTGKTAFKHPNDAETAMRHKRVGERRMVYHCKFCHHWHIGSTFGPKQSVESKRRKREAIEHERDY